VVFFTFGRVNHSSVDGVRISVRKRKYNDGGFERFTAYTVLHKMHDATIDDKAYLQSFLCQSYMFLCKLKVGGEDSTHPFN
jgi:hypothetical protein